MECMKILAVSHLTDVRKGERVRVDPPGWAHPAASASRDPPQAFAVTALFLSYLFEQLPLFSPLHLINLHSSRSRGTSGTPSQKPGLPPDLCSHGNLNPLPPMQHLSPEGLRSSPFPPQGRALPDSPRPQCRARGLAPGERGQDA